MPDGWIPAVTVGTPPRGGGAQEQKTFYAQSFNGTKSWGAQPASFTMVYVGDAQVTVGAEMTVVIGPHIFYGLCKTDTPVVSAGQGNLRTLQFTDFRDYLHRDQVFCAFNMPDVRLVNGVRVKRYWHIYPADFLANAKTFTTGPLSAQTILNAIFAAGTVLTAWTRIYHADMGSVPAFEVDCLSGKSLAAAVQEVSDKLGLVFTLRGNKYRLVWARKGEGALPSIPANSDDRATGLALSGNPTALFVRGGRNAYQLMGVDLLPDWTRAWEAFLTMEAFVDDLYQRGSDPRTGIRFNATPGDPDKNIGFHLTFARAHEITVWEYAALRTAVPLSTDVATGAAFEDWRMFHGRSRMDMPAALYINQLLFRAFRPNLTSFANWYGGQVPLDSIELADRLLTDVWHDANTGDYFWDTNAPLDGNGHAIVRGYRVGEDLFRTLRPEQFRADLFANAKAVWTQTPFQIDDSGEGQRFLIFDEPMIVCDDLFVEIDKQVVVNANFTLTVPLAKAALVFEAENFREIFGTGDLFATENVPSLSREVVASGGQFYEVPFADGQTATQKAAVIANALLLRQYSYYAGGYTVKGLIGTELTGMIDRVTVQAGPGGTTETIDWATERQSNAFQPEREFDRRTRDAGLLPGQAELREAASTARSKAAVFKANPGLLRRHLGDLVGGNVGPNEPLRVVFVKDAPAGTQLPAGTVLRKPVTDVTTSPNTKTQAVLPGAVDKDVHKVFEGVTVRHNEDASRPLRAQATGVAPVRVKGPASVNDTVGLSDGPGADDGNYLTRSGAIQVGRVLAEVASGETKLVPVSLGVGGGGGSVEEFQIVSVNDDHVVAVTYHLNADETEDLGTDLINIAKPQALRKTPFDGKTIDDITYTYTAERRSIVVPAAGVVPAVTYSQEVVPAYEIDDIIHATRLPNAIASDDEDLVCDWIEVLPHRLWLEVRDQFDVCIGGDRKRVMLRASVPYAIPAIPV